MSALQLDERIKNYSRCGVCLGEDIRGDIVCCGCPNEHNFCLPCIIGWASSSQCRETTFSCPACRAPNISLAFVPLLNDLAHTYSEPNSEPHPRTCGSEDSLINCVELDKLIYWKQVQRLAAYAHEIFPISFPVKEATMNMLNTKQVLLLAKNRVNLIRYAALPRRRRARGSFRWVNWNNQAYIAENRPYLGSDELTTELQAYMNTIINNAISGKPIQSEIDVVTDLLTERAAFQFDFT